MSKLAYGMLSGNYSQAPASDAASAESGQDGISPAMFKDLIGRGHFEFSTMRQQVMFL